MFLNFAGSPRHVRTLAHELGHRAHQYLSRRQGLLLARELWLQTQSAMFQGSVTLTEDYGILTAHRVGGKRPYCERDSVSGRLCVLIGAICFLLLGCVSLDGNPGERNLVVNSDFEAILPDGRPQGWEQWQKLNGAVFRTVVDPGFAHSGKSCVAIEYGNADQRNFAVWIQSIPVKARTTYRYGSSYVKVNLALVDVVGTVYFDSISLVASPFQKVASPIWLANAVVYELAPWLFSRFGDGRAFRGILSKLPALQNLGVTVLYLLPIWEDQGWYAITDHYAVFRKYGSERDLMDLVVEAHKRGMKVILDLAGTIGVPKRSRLAREHPEWFILNPQDTLYVSWRNELYGLDTNRADVQEYFIQFGQYYVERFDVDGYRCDFVAASPREMFQNIRAAIQRIKSDAILIAEDTQPVDLDKAFDVTYDFPFIDTISSLFANPHAAAKTVRWLETESELNPPESLRLRYLEGHDLQHTVASRYGLNGSIAFATFLLTIGGVPMIYSGQEVGNKVPQIGFWAPAMDWDGNPDAPAYRAAYSALIDIRAKYPALRMGSFIPVKCSDDRIAAFARASEGNQTIITVINLSAEKLDVHLDLSKKEISKPGSLSLSDLRTGERIDVVDTEHFTLGLQPFQSHVFLPMQGG